LRRLIAPRTYGELTSEGLYRPDNLAQTLHRDPTSPRSATLHLATKMPAIPVMVSQSSGAG
jgi:hypothetical protein